MPLEDVIAAVAKQTGYDIAIEPDADERKKRRLVSCEMSRVPFWEALDAVCEKTGAHVENGLAGRITIKFGDYRLPPIQYHQAFRLCPMELRYTCDKRAFLGASGNAQSSHPKEGLYFTMSLCAEPRLSNHSCVGVTFTEGRDDKGHSLIVNEPVFSWSNVGGETRIELLPPSASARVIQILKGSLAVALAGEEREHVLCDDVLNAKGKSIKVGNATIFVDDIYHHEKECVVDLRLRGVVREDELGFCLSCVLVDEKDREFDLGHQQRSIISAENGIRLWFSFRDTDGQQRTLPKTLKLRYLEAVSYVIPFEFRDLPLP